MTYVRLRHIVQVNPQTPAFNELADEVEITFLPMEAVWPGGRVDISQQKSKSEVSNGYTRFQNGDVLVPKITPTFEAARSVLINGLHNGVGAGTTELHVLRPGREIDGRFLLYLTNTHDFLERGKSEMYGVAGQKRVPDTFIKDFCVKLPSLDSQRRIADFLDAETARIDQLIRLRRRQVDIVNERYHSAISELTTPGISSDLERHTVWPWLPARIPIVRLGHLAKIQTGVTVHGSREQVYGGKSYPYLRVANVQGEQLDLSDIKEIVLPASMALRSTLQPGDVVMTEANGNPDNLGRGAVWRGEVPKMLHQNHIFAIRADRQALLPEYLSALLASNHGRRYFRHTSTQVGIATTSSSKVLNFPIPKIDIDQQREVVKRYHAERTRTQRTTEALEQQLKLLEERRRALITAAVTGQFDVSTASGRGVTE